MVLSCINSIDLLKHALSILCNRPNLNKDDPGVFDEVFYDIFLSNHKTYYIFSRLRTENQEFELLYLKYCLFYQTQILEEFTSILGM